jgi:hypothetical protein
VELVLVLLELTAVIVAVEEGGQEEHMDEDRACDAQDYTAEGDTLENKDADNEARDTCSAGGKDTEHVDTLPAIEHMVETDKHEEANVHKHEPVVVMNVHMSLVVNEHESAAVVVRAQVWWELVFAPPPCCCAILVWLRQDEKLRIPWGLSF